MAASIVLQGSSLVVIYPSGKTKNTGLTVSKGETKESIVSKVTNAKNIGIAGAFSTEDALAINAINSGAVANSIYNILNKETAKPATTPTKPATVPTKPATTPTKPATVPTKPATVPTKPATTPTKPTEKVVPAEKTEVQVKPKVVEQEIREATPRHNISMEWIAENIESARDKNDSKAKEGITNIRRYTLFIDKYLENKPTGKEFRSENEKKATALVFNALSNIPKFRLYLSSQASITPEFTKLLDHIGEGGLKPDSPTEIIEAADFFIRHYLLAFEARDNGSDQKFVKEVTQLEKTNWRRNRTSEVIARVEGTTDQAKKTEERKARFRMIYLGGAMDAETIAVAALYIRRWNQEKVHKRDPQNITEWIAPDMIPLRKEDKSEIKIPNIAIIGETTYYDGKIASELQLQLRSKEEKSTVKNYSGSGRSSNDYLKLFEKSALKDEHNVVIISGYARLNEPATSNDLFAKNIQKMVDMAKEHGKKVIIIGIPPINGWKSYNKDMEEKVNSFNRWAKENPDVLFIETTSLADSDGKLKKEYDSGDGLHLTKKGKIELARLILQQGFNHDSKRVKTPLEEYADKEWTGLQSILFSAVSRRDTERIINLEKIPDEVKNTMTQGKQSVDDALETLGRSDVRNAFDDVFKNILLKDQEFLNFVKSQDRYKTILGKNISEQNDKDRKVFVEAAQAYIQDRMMKDEKLKGDIDILQKQVYKKNLTRSGLDSMETLSAIALYRWREQNKTAPIGKWAENLDGIRIPIEGAKIEPPPSGSKKRAISF